MAKVNFSKVENILDEALYKMSIKHLNELAMIAHLLDDSKPKLSNQATEQILMSFQAQLKKFKKNNPNLYKKLGISAEEESKIFLQAQDLTLEEWSKLKMIKEKIDQLKKELHGQNIQKKEYDQQVERERLKHIYKRFNVREGWLPLK